MPDFKSSLVAFCDKTTKFGVYALVFLLPLFFLPFTSSVVDFNKQVFLIFFTFIAFFAWMLKTLVSGNLVLVAPSEKSGNEIAPLKKKWLTGANTIHLAVLFLLLAYTLSTIFSISGYLSFWGFSQVASESLISVICFVLLYFLVTSTFGQKEIFNSFLLLGVSALIVQIYAILQMCGVYVLGFSFARSISFNTIGSVGGLGLFLMLLLPLNVIFSVMTRNWWKLLFIVNTALTFVILLFINYHFLWIIAAVGSGLVIVFWIINRNIFDGRWMFLPIFFFVVSLFLIFYNPQIKLLPQRTIEVALSHGANVSIDAGALKSYALVGSGPGTFIYDFQKYKSNNFNNDILWNLNFNSGASTFLTLLPTVGILGFLALVVLMVCMIFYGFTFLLFKKSQQETDRTTFISVMLAILLVAALGFGLYNYNITLGFIFFFCLGGLAALISKDKKTYTLKPSSLTTLAITFIFTVLFIGGAVVLGFEGQRYFAETQYRLALDSFAQGKKDAGISYLKIAASNNKNSSAYFNALALFSLSSAQDEISNAKNNFQDPKEKQKVNGLVSDSISAINMAINLDPKNVDNWSMRGYICQNLTGLLSDAVSCAIKSYDQARQLAPTNPYLLVQEGNVYLSQAQSLPPDQNKDELLQQARDKYSQAINLKGDYALAYFQDALAAKLQGNTDSEFADLQNAQKYSSNDAAFLLQIGLAYYQEKNWQKAEESFQKSLALVPNYADALYYLGLTYDQLGRSDDAISTFSTLLNLNPNNQTVQKILDNLKNGKPALTGLVPLPPTPTVTPAPPGTVSIPTKPKH